MTSTDELAALCLMRMMKATSTRSSEMGESMLCGVWNLLLRRHFLVAPPPTDPLARVAVIVLSAYFNNRGDWGRMESVLRSGMDVHPIVESIITEADAAIRAFPPNTSEVSLLLELAKLYAKLLEANG